MSDTVVNTYSPSYLEAKKGASLSLGIKASLSNTARPCLLKIKQNLKQLKRLRITL
jgi:hypothetical protein